jgi:sulfonate transport system ATP-binding protein
MAKAGTMKTQAPLLSLKGVEKTYSLPQGDLSAVKGFNLEVGEGEFISVVGSSGCGKSTLLRLIAGLEKPTQGEILMRGEKIKGPGRDRGIIFQEPRLFPWMTVGENVAFGLKKGLPAPEAEEILQRVLERVGLEGFQKAYPFQLSGGMQQRAALARALVSRPRVLLLDEPFGALDALTRIQMQQEILEVWEKDKTTMMLVTHDLDEALYLGDRVAVMSPRPGTLKEMVAVKLSRPRDRSASSFVKIRRHLFNEFFKNPKRIPSAETPS